MKYVTIDVSGIIIQIAKTTDTQAYTEGVLQTFIPDKEERKAWSKADEAKWTKENNTRMKAICDFLNKNKL